MPKTAMLILEHVYHVQGVLQSLLKNLLCVKVEFDCLAARPSLSRLLPSDTVGQLLSLYLSVSPPPCSAQSTAAGLEHF